ncbi:DUF2490 domain-containing protein [Jejudonia soesokkakensis]|uniref:DUF2490 domain-containing protein n=1 Tax=Jejudonia soesokkakensis TaxID=1323432 RepID=A0ABW2MRX4_9FLAO
MTVFFISTITILKAQDTGEDQLGSWAILNGTHSLSDNAAIYTEFQYNTFEVLTNIDQFWAIGIFQHAIKNDITLGIGYGYFYTDSTFEDLEEENNFSENRLLEEIAFKHSFGKIGLQHRYRLEHRFFQEKINKTVVNRFRYRLNLKYPINSKWFIQAFDEIFINFNDDIFNQNRLFGAVGYVINDAISCQAGYMKIHLTGRNYDRLQFIVTINTDLQKKETVKP